MLISSKWKPIQNEKMEKKKVEDKAKEEKEKGNENW